MHTPRALDHRSALGKHLHRVPVETDNLRASGHVKTPSVQGKTIVSEGTFGEPTALYSTLRAKAPQIRMARRQPLSFLGTGTIVPQAGGEKFPNS